MEIHTPPRKGFIFRYLGVEYPFINRKSSGNITPIDSRTRTKMNLKKNAQGMISPTENKRKSV